MMRAATKNEGDKKKVKAEIVPLLQHESPWTWQIIHPLKTQNENKAKTNLLCEGKQI